MIAEKWRKLDDTTVFSYTRPLPQEMSQRSTVSRKEFLLLCDFVLGGHI